MKVSKVLSFSLGVLLAMLLVVSGQPEAFAQAKIYWTAGGHNPRGCCLPGCPTPTEILGQPFGQIQCANLDGTNVQILVANTNPLGSIRPTGIALDPAGGQLYWADFYCGIYAANLDGTNAAAVMPTGSWYALQGIEIDETAGQLYWGPTHPSFGGDAARIRRSNLDGSSVQVLVQNATSWFPGLLGLDAINGKIYWGEVSWNQGLFWSNLDGSSVQKIIWSIPVRDIAVDTTAGQIYFTAAWSFGGGGAIYRANLDGTGLQQIIGNLRFPYGIAVDPGAGKIYWSDINDGKIRQANLDGSGQVDHITGLVSPGGIALLLEVAVSVDIKPTSCPNPLNVKSKGVLTVAVLGTEDFDVTDIDPVTILLSREGHDGVPPLRWALEDVATPFEGELCECHDLDGDGYLDLKFKFDTQGLTVALNLGVAVGETIPLILTGNLKEDEGGTPIRGSDCVRVLETGKK